MCLYCRIRVWTKKYRFEFTTVLKRRLKSYTFPRTHPHSVLPLGYIPMYGEPNRPNSIIYFSIACERQQRLNFNHPPPPIWLKDDGNNSIERSIHVYSLCTVSVCVQLCNVCNPVVVYSVQVFLGGTEKLTKLCILKRGGGVTNRYFFV